MTETVTSKKQPKVYSVSDLFYTGWRQLLPPGQAQVYALNVRLKTLSGKEYGIALIAILRLLRKNWRLVDKLAKFGNEAKVVDIFNDLKFLNEPWFFFPAIGDNTVLIKPEDHLARHTFDHFIYADNEFTHFIATQDEKYLKRMALTLYRLPGEQWFDKECIEDRLLEFGDSKSLNENMQLIFFTFGHVREYVMKRCKHLLPPAPAVQTQDDASPIQPTGGMWLQLKHRLAETPAFQGYDNAGRANMYSALDYLEDLAKHKDKK